MAIQFNIGDTITINRPFVDSELASREPTAAHKALLEYLGSLGSANLVVGSIDPASLSIRVILIGITSGRKVWTVNFASESDLNQTFTMIQEVNTTSHQITVENGTTKMIPKGSFVVQTGWTGSNPEIPIVMDPPENEIEILPIFGIAEQDIFVGSQGSVLTQGLYSPINTEGYSIDAACFIGVENEVVQTMAGAHYRNVAIVVDVGSQGTIYIPAQPGGPYTCLEARSVSGIGNNKKQPDLGKAGVSLKRVTTPTYADGISSLVSRPNPRVISNTIFHQPESITNAQSATDYLWAWGQFLDHDIGLTEAATPAEALPITVSAGDPYFPPGVIPFTRSEYAEGTGGTSPRQQVNRQSSYIDGTNVYGADVARATRIRAMDGTGRLRTSGSDLLPKNTTLLPNAPSSSDSLYYLAGDVRANEQLLLIAIHTIFMREHNRIADLIRSNNNHLTGDQIYQAARRYNIAVMQHITYNEFLPLLLGEGTISQYRGYNPASDPGILNCFSTAFYRLGHSLVSPQLLRLDSDNKSIFEGPAQLRDAFFRPDRLLEGGGIEPLLRGAAQQVCQKVNTQTVTELRNFLFGAPGSGGLDLAALNIQRGRDHGLPAYNQIRIDLGLVAKRSYSQITSDESVKAKLVSVYASINEIDAWVGALAEDHVEGAMVGELIQHVCKRQFEALRDGDRFWYEAVFAGINLAEIKATSLADVIRRNTTINSELPNNVFVKS